MVTNIQRGFALIILFSFSLIATTEQQLPKIIIRNIENNTSEDLVIIDRNSKDKEILIAAGKTVDAKIVSNNNNVAIRGSMKDCMSEKAQFVIRQVTDKDQEVYLNVNVAPGGVNDGSGIISGTLGTTALKFLVAGKNGGMMMSSDTLKNNNNKTVEMNLKLELLKWAIAKKVLALDISYQVNEKQ